MQCPHMPRRVQFRPPIAVTTLTLTCKRRLAGGNGASSDTPALPVDLSYYSAFQTFRQSGLFNHHLFI